MPWINVGWGVQAWGTTPWGGYQVWQDDVVPPTGGFIPSRYERVRREYQLHREEREERNVIFKVHGLTAKMALGKCQIIAGHGIRVRLRLPRRIECSVGRVQVQAGTGVWATPVEVPASLCQCGNPYVAISVAPKITEGITAEFTMGVAKVRAIRNPTDEEFIMMIAEMLP